MSVATYDSEELSGLWVLLGGGEDVRFAIGALGCANRAAAMLTYGETQEPFELEREIGEQARQPVATWSADEWVGNLLYNCVSNGGTNFAPAEHRETVLEAAAKVDAAGLSQAGIKGEIVLQRAAAATRRRLLEAAREPDIDADYDLQKFEARVERLERMLPYALHQPTLVEVKS